MTSHLLVHLFLFLFLSKIEFTRSFILSSHLFVLRKQVEKICNFDIVACLVHLMSLLLDIYRIILYSRFFLSRFEIDLDVFIALVISSFFLNGVFFFFCFFFNLIFSSIGSRLDEICDLLISYFPSPKHGMKPNSWHWYLSLSSCMSTLYYISLNHKPPENEMWT